MMDAKNHRLLFPRTYNSRYSKISLRQGHYICSKTCSPNVARPFNYDNPNTLKLSLMDFRAENKATSSLSELQPLH